MSVLTTGGWYRQVRDESDRDGLRIAIELKKDANADLILNLVQVYGLQVNYNFNMVAIDNSHHVRWDCTDSL